MNARALLILTALTALLLALAASADSVVVERGPHHRIWQRTEVETLPDGRAREKLRSFVELASGMHRQTPGGSWVETSPRIEVSPDRQHGLVQNLQYQVIFAANLATPNALDISLPDGSRLTGHLLGLFYFDGQQSAMIAEPKDVFGEIGGAEQNELLFRDAFTDVLMDVQYVVERGRLSQNIILRRQLPSPVEFGLTEQAVLTVLTEWTAFPDVQKQPRARARAADLLPDEHISLGAMQFARGRALAIGGDAVTEVNHVHHSWEIFDGGRNCLVEQIPWKEVEPELRDLPPANVDAAKRWKRRRIEGQARNDTNPSFLPQKRGASAMTGKMQMASATPPQRPGYLLDFELVTGSTIRFEANRTYYVSGDMTLISPHFDGGCVIKFSPTNSAAIRVSMPYNPMTWAASGYQPVIMTARDDHSVGEPIGTNALSGYYAATALELDENVFDVNLQNFRIAYAQTGLDIDANEVEFKHAQFIGCQTAIKSRHPVLRLRNALVVDCNKAFALTQTEMTGEHLTVHRVPTLFSQASGSGLELTNCLLISVTNGLNYTGANVVTNLNDTGIFQTVGAGSHYLIAGSTNRNAGTTNVNAQLRADLRQRTTYPPALLTNTIKASTNLVPVVGRDIDTPDLGYSYPVIDYAANACVITNNATVNLVGGTVIAAYGPNALWLRDGSVLNSEGLPLQPTVLFATMPSRSKAPIGAVPLPLPTCRPITAPIPRLPFGCGSPTSAPWPARITISLPRA